MSVNFSGQAPNNYPTNNRAVLDANFIQNVALPNAANTTNTNAIDLQVATPYPTTEVINVQVIIQGGTGANNKNINVGIQMTTPNTDGTANSTNWVNITTLAAPILINADNNNTGHVASNVIFKLPPLCNEFIRAQFTGEANGGNAANANGTLQLLF